MELMIQDPTYSATMRLGEALIDACNIGGNGAGAFAFAEEKEWRRKWNRFIFGRYRFRKVNKSK